DRAAYLRGELTEPEQPIVYYLDPAIPEPYRSAFREGGMWWSGVFEAAGFRNAFQIRDLPEGANPMDARYPMIYWVHRVDPGPSVGPSYRDPRTGEILSTVVRMDSHRSLVDFNIYAGLVPAAGPQGLSVTAEQFAMARRRQHTAHEIGHTLGLQHNFIAGSQGRASFMDYPFPLISLDAQGRIQLGDAYRVGGGAWDSLAVRYAYTWFPDEASERAGLQRIMADGLARGLRYITGGHASAAGSIPEATQWVEGATMFDAVERTSRVRRVLLDRFDERAIQPGEPMSMLNQRFAHVYLHHRYSLEGLVKYVGGMDFTYALRGDGQTPARVLPAAEQRRALRMALAALEPAELAFPARIADLIPPSPPGTDGSEIWLATQAGTALDPITIAGGLATEVIENLLHPQRAQRLVLFHIRDAGNPSLEEVITALVDASWGAAPSSDRAHQALRRTVQRVALNTMLDLAGDNRTSAEARAVTASMISRLGARIAAMQGGSAEDQGHRALALRDIRRFEAGEDDRASRPRFPVIPLPWP
ncbi:MAG: zinc-dependent metalloprotease, partial [Gemmatimonadales bacterium]|nr:zinc-dependent metalloprotease [Gemmatimonadales bacterium]